MTALAIGVGLLFIVLFFIALIAKLMVVGNPSELLVISGKRAHDGQGYRTLIGGRTLVIPIIEEAARISLRNMQVALEVNAQSGGGKMIPVTVTGVANVKVSSEEGVRGNAIERFLGQPEAEMQRVARETLEGGLRAVIGKAGSLMRSQTAMAWSLPAKAICGSNSDMVLSVTLMGLAQLRPFHQLERISLLWLLGRLVSS